MSRNLVAKAINDILDLIASGDFTPDTALPAEKDFADLLEVSRLTLREAVRVLKDRNVLNVVHGRGTYVCPESQWTDLSTIATFQSKKTDPVELGIQLLEVRRMVEVGSAGLAAENRTPEHLKKMRSILKEYQDANAAKDVLRTVDADIAFHETIQAASGNPFVRPIMHPLRIALETSRNVTSAHPEVRERAHQHHLRIFRAIEAGDSTRAKEAMRAHMTQTGDDLGILRG